MGGRCWPKAACRKSRKSKMAPKATNGSKIGTGPLQNQSLGATSKKHAKTIETWSTKRMVLGEKSMPKTFVLQRNQRFEKDWTKLSKYIQKGSRKLTFWSHFRYFGLPWSTYSLFFVILVGFEKSLFFWCRFKGTNKSVQIEPWSPKLANVGSGACARIAPQTAQLSTKIR